MNREIKFRAWDKEAKKFLHEQDVFSPDTVPVIPSGITFKLKSTCVVFLQYTGLKDDDGIEIYEGDYLTGRKNPILVEYHAPEFRFTYRNPDKDNWLTHLVCGWGDISKVKVIGNIFQNPELAKNE